MARGLLLSAGGAALLIGLQAGGTGKAIPTPNLVTATITVDQRSVTQTAGEMVVFDLDLSGTGWTLNTPSPPTTVYDQTTAYHVEWDFDDSYAFTNAGLAGDLSYETWNGVNYAGTESRYAIGRKAAHFYRNAGSYSPTCMIWEVVDGKPTGNVAYGSMASPLVVAARSTEYATYCLSNDTSHTGAPAETGTPGTVGSVQHVDSVTDLDAWYAANVAGQESTPVQILLNAGDTFTWSGYQFGQNSDYPDTVFGTYGTGRATVTVTGTMWINDTNTALADYSKDIRWENIDFNGQWSSATNSGSNSNFCAVLGTNALRANQLSFDNCIITGTDISFYIAPSTAYDGFALCLNDTEVSDFRRSIFQVYEFGKVVTVGCSLKSHPNAYTYYGANTDTYIHRGRVDLWIHQGCNFFSKQGWFPGGTYRDTQPCLRLDAEQGSACEVYITRNVLEGGNTGICRLGTESGGGNPNAMKGVLWDSNVMVGSYDTSMFIQSYQGGIDIRNNLCVHPYTVSRDGAFVGSSFTFTNVNDGGGTGDSLNLSGPIRIYNNTVINLMQGSNSVSSVTSVIPGYTNTVLENNILHQPSLTSPSIPDNPLDGTTALFTSVSEGFRDGSGAVADTGYSQVIYSYAPESGSTAIDDVDMVTGGGTAYAPHDRTGALRGSVSGSTFTPSSPDRGAAES